MTLINKLIRKFRENIFWLFIVELLFLILTSFIGFFGYKEIQTRLDFVNTFSPRLNELAVKLQGPDLSASDMAELPNQLAGVEMNVQILKLLMILVPLGLFFTYSFFQGISWHTISKDKFDIKRLVDWKYLLGFFGISLIYFSALYLFWHFLFINLSLNIFFPVITLITLILFYFLFISYIALHKYNNIFNSIKKGISLGFSNIGKLMPVVLVFLIVMPAIIFLATLFTNVALYVITGIFLVLVWILFKIALTERLNKLI